MRRIIGLDIHKTETQACVMDAKGRIIEETRFPTREAAFKNALKKYPRSEAIIETTGVYRPVAKWLQAQGHEVHLANTVRIEKPKVKTDKKDAKHLASLHRADLLPEAYLPPPEIQHLRDITRQRHFLGQEAANLKGKIKHHLLKHGHFTETNPAVNQTGRAWLRKLAIPEITSCLVLLEHVETEKHRFEKLIELEASTNADAKLLMTIPGVSSFTALLIVAEVGDFRRFEHKDALASLAGLALKQSQSGDTDVRGRITRQGRPLLRWILVQAARNHLAACPESAISVRHRRLAKKRGSSKASVATARVMITIMHTMIARGEAFRVTPP